MHFLSFLHVRHVLLLTSVLLLLTAVLLLLTKVGQAVDLAADCDVLLAIPVDCILLVTASADCAE